MLDMDWVYIKTNQTQIRKLIEILMNKKNKIKTSNLVRLMLMRYHCSILSNTLSAYTKLKKSNKKFKQMSEYMSNGHTICITKTSINESACENINKTVRFEEDARMKNKHKKTGKKN
jgi:hypothetical protein